ncbi:MCE family protein [Actinomycetes bacterium KLBMP 9759]
MSDKGLSLTDRRHFQWTAIIAVVALLVATGLYLLLRPAGRTVTAYFTSASAVFEDNGVRMLGVPVGRITAVVPEGTRVRVDMQIDDPDIVLPADVRAVVISPSLVTGRYIQLTPMYTGGPQLADAGVIPLERTAVPLGVDDLARTASELSKALGPQGANAEGAISDVLNVGAENLAGNGQAVNDSIRNLGELSGTLADSREELFGTVTQLQSFVSNISANDQQVREFNGRLAEVAGFLADERGDLASSVSELSLALGDVADFVEDNRESLKGNIDKLNDVTKVLVKQQDALAEIFDVAPAALSNLVNTYNGSSGTLDTRADINELTQPPIVLICEMLKRGAPKDVPKNLADTCSRLGGVLDGAVPLPSAAEVITSLQAGKPPPLPGLALPTEPADPAEKAGGSDGTQAPPAARDEPTDGEDDAGDRSGGSDESDGGGS